MTEMNIIGLKTIFEINRCFFISKMICNFDHDFSPRHGHIQFKHVNMYNSMNNFHSDLAGFENRLIYTDNVRSIWNNISRSKKGNQKPYLRHKTVIAFYN